MRKKAKKPTRGAKKAKDLPVSGAKAKGVKGGITLSHYVQYSPVSPAILRSTPPNPV